jgi:hypothetical protein
MAQPKNAQKFCMQNTTVPRENMESRCSKFDDPLKASIKLSQKKIRRNKKKCSIYTFRKIIRNQQMCTVHCLLQKQRILAAISPINKAFSKHECKFSFSDDKQQYYGVILLLYMKSRIVSAIYLWYVIQEITMFSTVCHFVFIYGNACLHTCIIMP